MANLRTAQKEMTRQLLLDTAVKSFEAKGFASTTVDDIVSAAGATRTTFYLHFDSKAELLRALLSRLSEYEIGAVESQLRGVIRDGRRDEIAEWLRETSGLWKSMRPYVNAAHEAAALNPELRKIVDDWMQSAVDGISDGLSDAQRFEPSTREIRGVLAFSQLEHLSRRWMLRGWEIDRDLTLELLTESWMRLLTD